MILSKAYDEIMEKIKVTDEMRTRILHNIKTLDITPTGRIVNFRSWKKYLSVAACFAILLAGTFTVSKILSVEDEKSNNGVLSFTANIEEFSSVTELANNLGFKVKDIENLPFKVNDIKYYSYWNEMAQIEYQGSSESAMYRKSKGDEDNSGDYNEYEDVIFTDVEGISVTLKGENGLYKLAVWKKEGYSYSLSFEKGINYDTFVSVIKNID